MIQTSLPSSAALSGSKRSDAWRGPWLLAAVCLMAALSAEDNPAEDDTVAFRAFRFGLPQGHEDMCAALRKEEENEEGRSCSASFGLALQPTQERHRLLLDPSVHAVADAAVLRARLGAVLAAHPRVGLVSCTGSLTLPLIFELNHPGSGAPPALDAASTDPCAAEDGAGDLSSSFFAYSALAVPGPALLRTSVVNASQLLAAVDAGAEGAAAALAAALWHTGWRVAVVHCPATVESHTGPASTLLSSSSSSSSAFSSSSSSSSSSAFAPAGWRPSTRYGEPPEPVDRGLRVLWWRLRAETVDALNGRLVDKATARRWPLHATGHTGLDRAAWRWATAAAATALQLRGGDGGVGVARLPAAATAAAAVAPGVTAVIMTHGSRHRALAARARAAKLAAYPEALVKEVVVLWNSDRGSGSGDSSGVGGGGGGGVDEWSPPPDWCAAMARCRLALAPTNDLLNRFDTALYAPATAAIMLLDDDDAVQPQEVLEALVAAWAETVDADAPAQGRVSSGSSSGGSGSEGDSSSGRGAWGGAVVGQLDGVEARGARVGLGVGVPVAVSGTHAPTRVEARVGHGCTPRYKYVGAGGLNLGNKWAALPSSLVLHVALADAFMGRLTGRPTGRLGSQEAKVMMGASGGRSSGSGGNLDRSGGSGGESRSGDGHGGGRSAGSLAPLHAFVRSHPVRPDDLAFGAFASWLTGQPPLILDPNSAAAAAAAGVKESARRHRRGPPLPSSRRRLAKDHRGDDGGDSGENGGDDGTGEQQQQQQQQRRRRLGMAGRPAWHFERASAALWALHFFGGYARFPCGEKCPNPALHNAAAANAAAPTAAPAPAAAAPPLSATSVAGAGAAHMARRACWVDAYAVGRGRGRVPALRHRNKEVNCSRDGPAVAGG